MIDAGESLLIQNVLRWLKTQMSLDENDSENLVTFLGALQLSVCM